MEQSRIGVMGAAGDHLELLAPEESQGQSAAASRELASNLSTGIDPDDPYSGFERLQHQVADLSLKVDSLEKLLNDRRSREIYLLVLVSALWMATGFIFIKR